MSRERDTLRPRAPSKNGQRLLVRCRSEPVDGDPVLASIAAAPVVPLTEAERAALAEVERDPAAWLAAEDVLAALPKSPHP